VIKPGAGPTSFVVTLLAFPALLPFMHIVTLMTGNALCLQFLLVKRSGVTGLAGDLDVLASQGIAR
jgi:hypothetical protein